MSWKIQNLVNRAYGCIENNDYRKAVSFLEKAVGMGSNNGDLYAYLGEAYYLNGEYDKALNAFEQRDRLLLQSHPLTPYIEGYRGSICLEKGNRDDAERLLQKSIDADVKEPEVFYKMAVLRMLQGDFLQARRLLGKIDRMEASFNYKKIQKLLEQIAPTTGSVEEK